MANTALVHVVTARYIGPNSILIWRSYYGPVWIHAKTRPTKKLASPRILTAVWIDAKKLARPACPTLLRVICANVWARRGRRNALPKNWRGDFGC